MERKPNILLSLALSNPPAYAQAVEAAGGVPVGDICRKSRRCTTVTASS